MVLSINIERINFYYPTKIIPIPSINECKIQLLSKNEKLIKRMQWKALEYFEKLNDSVKETYGFIIKMK